VKYYIKKLVLSEAFSGFFTKSLGKVVASWKAPDVLFLPECAGYRRDHPKLTYSMTG
jgi:hypothetical protein